MSSSLLSIAHGAKLNHVNEDPVEHSKIAGVHTAVIRDAVAEGASHKHLHHVDAPKDGLSAGVKDAYLADHNKTGAQRGGDCCGNCDCKDSCKCGDKSKCKK